MATPSKQMISHDHSYDIGIHTLSALDNALALFTAQHAATLDSWYHDMPVWILRRTRGNVTTSVQVDAIVERQIGETAELMARQTQTRRHWLYFTPDSYEDRELGES